jgi:hypothetical protein
MKMADNQDQYGFYQIPHVGLTEGNAPTLGNPVQTRDLNMRMSNFGALWVGPRMTASTLASGVGIKDYTRVAYGFEAKGAMEGAAEFGLHDVIQDAEKNENPLVWGSTVKYTRNDEMFKMGMATDDTGDKKASYEVRLPAKDVMDTELVDASGMEAYRNYPTEGWRSFGGKYDFLPYSGGGFTH